MGFLTTKELQGFLRKGGVDKSLLSRIDECERLSFGVEVEFEDAKQARVGVEFINQRDGKWEVLYPNAERPQAIRGTEACLRDELLSIAESARGFMVRYLAEGRRDEIVGLLRAALDDGQTAEALELSEMGVRARIGVGYDTYLYAPLIALAFCVEGEHAIGRGDLMEATFCADRAAYWSSPSLMSASIKRRLSERAKAGAIGKAKRSEKVRVLVAGLLIKLRPSEGWQNKKHAISSVVDELQSCPDNRKLVKEAELSEDNLVRTLGDWIRRSPDQFPLEIGLPK